MLFFSLKNFFYSLAIIFFAFILFILPTLINNNTAKAQSCEAPYVEDPDGGPCILEEDIQNRDTETKTLDSETLSITPEQACADLKGNSGKYLNCIQKEKAKNLPASAFKGVEETASCSSLDTFFKNPIACTARGLGWAVLTILAYLTSLAGQIFDFSAKFSILGMGTLIGSAENGINIAWSTIRDLGNIIFIFMLLWISIMNILQMGDAKKFIPTLIIAALLVNFSLFFTKIIIDTSNIVAVQFYSSIISGLPAGSGISSAFMEKFDAETMLSGDLSNGTAWGVTAQMWSTAIMVFIMFFIFLQASFLFIARTAVLIFLLPFSPIMFLGTVLPKIKKYTDQWWEELICNSLSAPIYFLLIWVSLQILSSVTVVKSGKGISDALSGLSGYGLAGVESAGIIFNYLLVCVFLIASYKTAKCSGISGKIASGLMTAVGAVAGGVGGFAGRQMIGRGVTAFMGREGFKNFASSSSVGRLALRATEGVAKSNFDVRDAEKIPLVGGVASNLVKTAGVGLDLGKKPENVKDGYIGEVKRAEEKLAEDRASTAKLLEAKKVELTEEEKEKAKLTKEEISNIILTEKEKAGKSDAEIYKLNAEKREALAKEKLKNAEATKQRTVTQERQGAYFDQLKAGKGEVIPQAFKLGDKGGTKGAEKEIDQKYKADREIAVLEETIKNLMGSHGSIKEAIDAFTKTSANLSIELEDIGKSAGKEARAKLFLEREQAKTNARTLQNYVNRLEGLKNKDKDKK